MSLDVRHFLESTEFRPVNYDDFAINFERDPNSRFSDDITATNIVRLPSEMYTLLLNHLNTNGVQKAMHYDININGTIYPFIADLTDGVSIAETEAEIKIEKFKSKDDIIKNIQSLTFESLYQQGYIKQSDMVDIYFVIVPDDMEMKMLYCLLMIFVVADQVAQGVKATGKLIGELIDAITPDVTTTGPDVKIGTVIKFALLIIVELAKIVVLFIALLKLAKQFIELIHPKLRIFKAMTVDKLLTIGLAREGLTYQSVLTSEFKKLTILPVPIDFKNKKWYEVLKSDDDRILNRGYPTSSDTTPTLMNLIDEICNMYNINRPYISQGVLYLQPKAYYLQQAPTVTIANNKNLQDLCENKFAIDCSKFWKTKILSYQNDPSDKFLFDNPKGLRVEYQAYTNDTSEWTKIRGYERININFALGTKKQETVLEGQIKTVCKALDKFLGTSLLAKAKKRDGVLALSQAQFNVTKLLYQQGGKQTIDFLNHISAFFLYENYHYMDTPANECYRVYNEMPVPMNNDIFNEIAMDKTVALETGEKIEILSCSYTPQDAVASVTFRKQDLNFSKTIKTRLIYAE